MATNIFGNFAFISYSHSDMAVAKWIQKRLEQFKLPTEIHNEIDAQSRYLRPIFRDQSDLNTGILGDELRRHLERSKYLILICSKNSAKSQWVSDEARAFVELGRLEHIIPVIISDGQTPERDLFPKYLRDYFSSNPNSELLGVNIGEVGREKALIRIVSKMLDVEFDSLWNRHLRQKRTRIITSSLLSTAILTSLYFLAVPLWLSVDIEFPTSNLPLGDEIKLTVDGAEYIHSIEDPNFHKISIPGFKRFAQTNLKIETQFFQTFDTSLNLGAGVAKNVKIDMLRDSTFAVFAGNVYDSELLPLSNVKVNIDQYEAITGPNGHFRIVLPLASQLPEKRISLRKIGYKPILRDDEVPGKDIKFIMHPVAQ